MPGIVGCYQKKDGFTASKMAGKLYKTQFGNIQISDTNGVDIAVLSLNQTPYIFTKGNITIAFDGYIINTDLSGTELLQWILNQFLKIGELFVKELRGSFQIVIIKKSKHGDIIYLYGDHTASRQMFFIETNDSVYFAPEIAPLIDFLPEKKINDNALIHFLICGYFPSGNTLIKQVNKLLPGEYIIIQNNKIKRNRYYTYCIKKETQFEFEMEVDKLNTLLEGKIIDNWKHACKPAILLSGGTDSQYIFYTIAEYVADTTKLTTVSWGRNKRLKNSDMKIASETSKKFGTRHLIFNRDTNDFKSEFFEMFAAQSGMTDSSFYHANELTIMKQLREQYGIRSIFRGDECFGFEKEVYNQQKALNSIGMSFPEFVFEKEKWFKNELNLFKSYSEFINALVSNYDLSANDLKDTLYCNERLVMIMHPLNYFKYHYQHVFDPFIDVDILSFVRNIPSKYRDDKMVFRRCLEKKFYKRFQYCISGKNNLVNWREEIAASRNLQNFLKQEINMLPDLFNKEYYIICLNKLSKKSTLIKKYVRLIYTTFSPQFCIKIVDKIKRAQRMRHRYKKDEFFGIASQFLIFRIVVLSRWFQCWINMKKQ